VALPFSWRPYARLAQRPPPLLTVVGYATLDLCDITRRLNLVSRPSS
jgi:hypothetical protein